MQNITFNPAPRVARVQPPAVVAGTALPATVMVLLFLYATHARLYDFLAVHGVLYSALLHAIVALMAVLLMGDLISALRSTTGLLLIAFTGWMIFSIPFSVWPMGAFETLKEQWIKSAVVYFVVAGGLLTFENCRSAAYAMAFATATIVALAFRYGYNHGGRFVVGSGTFGNSNDFATYLLIGTPFVVYALVRASKPRKVFWLAILMLGMYYLLKTGSRGALVALGVAGIYAFLKSPMKAKFLVVGLMLGGIVTAPVILPQRIIDRYATIFSDSATTPSNEAQASTESRLELMRRGFRLTVEKPLFGVGAGMFPLAAWGNIKGHVTHNTYLQVSSETGIPGLLIYLAALFLSFHTVGTVMKNTRNNPAFSEVFRIAYALRAAWILFAVTAFFSSVAYGLPIIVLMSLTEVLRNTTAMEIAGQPQPVQPARPPVPARPALPVRPAQPGRSARPIRPVANPITPSRFRRT